MRLRCIKYEFNTDLIAQVNFFNRDVSRTAIAEVDLYDYLILDSLKDNSYKSPNVNEQSQDYYFEANGVSLSVSGAKDYDYLISFFEINTLATNFKWLLHQYNDAGNLIFSSIISKDNVSLSVVEDRDITIQSTAYELEFKEWAMTVKLFSLNNWEEPFTIEPGVPLAKFKSLPLISVLEQLFSGGFLTDIIVDNDIAGWLVSKVPYFYVGFPDFYESQMDILSGYDNFVYQQLSRYEYLNSLCKSMGWKWFFYLGKLYIRNLYTTEGDVIEIDYEKLGENGVIETGIENTFLNLKIDTVIIDNGELRGGRDSTIEFVYGGASRFGLAGERKVVFSKDLDYTNLMLTSKRYVVAGFPSTSGFGYAGVIPPVSNMLRYKDDQFDMFRFDNIILESLSTEPRNNLSNFLKGRTLEIKVACNTERVTRIDMSNTRFTSGFPFIEPDPRIYNGQFTADAGDPITSDEDLQFCGNVGSMLYKFNTALNKFVTYQWYINESQQFVDNFSTYLGADLLQLFRVKGDGIQYNPLNRYKIVNYPTDILNIDNKIFAMQSLSFNQFENTFELKVMVK